MSGAETAPGPPDGGAAGWLVRSDQVLAALSPLPPGLVVRACPAPAAVLDRVALLWPGGPAGGIEVAWCRTISTAPLVPPPGAEVAAGIEIEVHRVRLLRPGHPLLVRPGAGAVVLAGPGAFERWALRVGDRLGVRSR